MTRADKARETVGNNGADGDDGLDRWRLMGLAALAVIVLSVPLYLLRQSDREETAAGPLDTAATFVGREQCIDCHDTAYQSWQGSDHDNAMDHATGQTVLGDFDDATFDYDGVSTRFYRRDGRYFVYTEGPGGEMAEFEVLYTFGIEPLQQYLVPLPGGRLQALSTAWDTERKEWFFLYPGQDIAADDWLHWSRNGQNWNGMCAECHSTHLQKNYHAETRSFETTWSEVDVSCEACHGPGSRHVAWASIDPMGRPDLDNYGLEVRTSGIDNRQQVEICAPCHSRRAELGDYDHRQTDLLEFLLPSLLSEGLYHADGQILEEDYVWGSFVQSKMYRNGVRCSDCHDPHSLQLHREGNALCLQCHRADTYDSYEHHFHQPEYEGKPSDGVLCVKCHMPEQPFMVIDYRADHSLRVPRPDLSLEIGVPNACSQSGCHDDQSLQWAVDAYTEWYGKARKPHYGTIFAAARAGDAAAAHGLATLVENPLYPAIVRATALSALQDYPGERSDRLVLRSLADEDSLLRYTAVTAAAGDRPEQLVKRLAPLLSDPVRTVRMQAASRLADVPRSLFRPYQLEALDATLADYVQAMEERLDFASSGMNLGNLYRARGDAGAAEKYYRLALEVDDKFFPAKMNLAVLLSEQQRDPEAEQLLREILRDYPEQYDAAYYLALVLVATNRPEEALEYLTQAALGLPNRSRVHYNFGLLLAQMGHDREAEAALQHALGLEPQSIDYLYALIDFYARRGQRARALDLVERLIATHPDNPLGQQLKQALGGIRSE